MAEALQEQATEKIEYECKKAKKEKKSRHGRMLLPSHLRREEIIKEPEDHPEDAIKIGEKVTEILEIQEAEIYVKKFTRPKYVLPEEAGITVGGIPSLPIPKGNAGPSLLSHILIGKPACRHHDYFVNNSIAVNFQISNHIFECIYICCIAFINPGITNKALGIDNSGKYHLLAVIAFFLTLAMFGYLTVCFPALKVGVGQIVNH